MHRVDLIMLDYSVGQTIKTNKFLKNRVNKFVQIIVYVIGILTLETHVIFAPLYAPSP